MRGSRLTTHTMFSAPNSSSAAATARFVTPRAFRESSAHTLESVAWSGAARNTGLLRGAWKAWLRWSRARTSNDCMAVAAGVVLLLFVLALEVQSEAADAAAAENVGCRQLYSNGRDHAVWLLAIWCLHCPQLACIAQLKCAGFPAS